MRVTRSFKHPDGCGSRVEVIFASCGRSRRLGRGVLGRLSWVALSSYCLLGREASAGTGMSQSQPILKISCPHCGQKLDVTGLQPFTRINCPVCQGQVIIPRRFDQLFLEEPVGSGGMARVYRALDVNLDREVAVKILNENITKQPDRVKLFLNEARSAAAVNDPHVVPIYSCGEFEDQPYLVMQYMGGLSLDRQIQKEGGFVSIEFCLKSVASVARGLGAAYRHGIIHHDVKPGNILVDVDGNVKIGDFGLAQIVRDENAPAIEELLRHWASPYYVSPEKARVGKEDHRGDIYSLGATLYHAVTGRPPWTGGSAKEIIFARLKGEPPVPPHQLRPEVSTAVSDYVLRMLSENVADRPQTYEQIYEALEEYRESLLKGGQPRKAEGPKRVFRVATAGAPGEPGAGAGAGVSDAPPSTEELGPVLQDRINQFVNMCITICVALMVIVAIAVVRIRPGWYVTRVEPRLRSSLGLPPAAAKPVPVGAGRVLRVETRRLPAPGGTGVEESPPVRSPSGGGGALPPAVSIDFQSATDFTVQPTKRPCPEDLDFARAKSRLQAYINAVPAARREIEKQRLGSLSQVRTYLIRLMKYLPFNESAAVVKLRDGRTLSGTVPYCNENEVMVRGKTGTASLQKLAWGDLAFEQYARFFEFYIRTRLEQGASASAGIASAKHRKEAADDCFRLALLCDWYGYAKAAQHYSQLARRYDPTFGAKLDQMIPAFEPDKPL